MTKRRTPGNSTRSTLKANNLETFFCFLFFCGFYGFYGFLKQKHSPHSTHNPQKQKKFPKLFAPLSVTANEMIFLRSKGKLVVTYLAVKFMLPFG